MFDTVKVDPESFRSVMFRAALARKEFIWERVPEAEKPQKRDGSGVPLWSVKLVVEDWRGRDHIISVTVPMQDHPETKFSRGDLVELHGLVFGITAKREGGFTTWMSADGISSVSGQTTVGVGTTAA